MTSKSARQAIAANIADKILSLVPDDGSWIPASEIAAKAGTSTPAVGRVCGRRLRHQVIVVREPKKPVEIRRVPELCRPITTTPRK